MQGVGKTAITEGLAQRIAAGNIPPKLKGYTIWSLDMGALLAGTKFRGDFEERIKKVIDILLKKEKAILSSTKSIPSLGQERSLAVRSMHRIS